MMKKYFSVILLTLAIAASSCKKGYLNLTDNPNAPSVSSPDLLLTGALKTTADIVNGGDYVMYAAWTGYLSQSTGYQPFVDLEQYQFTTSNYQAVWTGNYLNIANYNSILNSSAGPNYQAIAKIMIAYDFEALVDNYNNVPYTSALKGASNLNPTYQKGSDIYDDLMKQLDAAIVLIQKAPATAATPQSADIMFGGDMTKWLKFANTLKLRLAIRESNLTNAALVSAAQATSSLGYIDDTFSASVNPGYTNSDANGGQQSPLWRYYGTNQSGGAQGGKAQYQANSFAANYFAANNDPRLLEVYSASGTAGAGTATNITPGTAINVQNGAAIVSTTFGDSQPPLGDFNGQKQATIKPSLVGSGLLVSASQNAVIMSSAESLFLQSEGVARGVLTSGDAAALYNAGIAASFEFDQVPNADAAAATYAAQPAIAYPTGGTLDAKVKAIITQKWSALAIFGSFEAFNEERRTGFPNVPTSIYPGANAPNQVARILYPFVEYQTNTVNVQGQGTIDKFSSKIFWAK